jgi:pilus assembly protein CpaC
MRPVILLLALGILTTPALSAALPPNGGIPPLIQIGVEVVEVDETKSLALGIDWFSQLHVAESDVPSLFTVGSLARGKIFADIEALMQKGAADLLANPKLVARDGTTAVFHAGGELPYAASGSLGTVSVEFKPYGVSLKISPHVDENGRIAMTLDAEVSGPDEGNSVMLAGNKVPGLRTRRVSPQLTLPAGATLTMAGLIQNQKQTTRRGVPGLMQIPVLGYLFSHKAESNTRTSIIVFVTPIILEPSDWNSAPPLPALVPPPAARPVPPSAASLEPVPGTDDLLSRLDN